MQNEKPWFTSSTILASLGTIVVSLGSVMGYQIDPTIFPDIAAQVALMINALMALWAIRGRMLATTKIG